MNSRIVRHQPLNDDPLPLHPQFYEFIEKDEKGYFVVINGFRFEVLVAPQHRSEPENGSRSQEP